MGIMIRLALVRPVRWGQILVESVQGIFRNGHVYSRSRTDAREGSEMVRCPMHSAW